MEIFVEAVLAVLMLITCIWCWLIHTRLRKLRCDRTEISEFVGTLTTATSSAEAVIKGLRTVGNDAEKKLLRQRDGIQRQNDEMVKLLDVAGRTIKRLDEATRNATSSRTEIAVGGSNRAKTARHELLGKADHHADPAVSRAPHQRAGDPVVQANEEAGRPSTSALLQALQALQ